MVWTPPRRCASTSRAIARAASGRASFAAAVAIAPPAGLVFDQRVDLGSQPLGRQLGVR